MRKQITLALALLVAPHFASAESTYEKQVEFEQKITDQITTKLNKIISPNSYQLIVNGTLQLDRRRVKIEEQVDQSAKGMQQKTTAATQALPGFNVSRVDQEGRGSNDLSQTSKTKYKYVENLIVDGLDVYLIYSDSLPTERQELATSIVDKHLKSTFGKKVNIITSVAAVTPPSGALTERLSTWLGNYLDVRAGDAIDLLYLVMIGLFVLVTCMAVWGYFWKKRRAVLNATKPVTTNGESSGRIQQDVELARSEAKEVMVYVVDALTNDPLVTQSFLRQLKYADKITLISYIHSPALAEHLIRVLGIQSTFREDVSKLQQSHSKEKTEKLKTIVEDLKHYRKLQEDMTKSRFGYLSLLEPQVLYNYFASAEGMLDKLALASRYLPQNVFVGMTAHLTVEQKAQLFQKLQNNDVKESFLDQMEIELRSLFEKQRREISCPSEAQQLQSLLLENDLYADELIETMSRQGVSFPEELKKYAVNINNWLTQDQKVTRKVLDELSNEDIAKAYAKSSLKYELKDFMPENRFKLIEAMMMRFHKIDDEQVKEAQLRVLGAYRLNV